MSRDLYRKCPFVTAQKVLQGKWTILIMHYLSEKPIRFNELQRMLPSMTHATLSKQLKQMGNNGLIIRTEYPQIPPKVEYELGTMGKELLPTLNQFREFGLKYIDYLNDTKSK